MLKHLRTDSKPFSLHPDDHDQDDHDSWKEILFWIPNKLHEMFITFLPLSEAREYPPRFMYLTGVIAFTLIGVFFFTLFGFLFITNIRNVYLSPANGGPDFSGARCEEIQSTNTGIFLGTKEGIWEGNSGFQYSEATYIITASNWKMSLNDYSSAMNQLYTFLSQLGNQATQLDLAQNLLLWFSFMALADQTNPSNRFALIGDPAVALNRQYIFGSVSSIAGECKLPDQYAYFDKSNGELILNIPYDAYKANPICMAAGDPLFLGYNPFTTMNNFQVKVDVYSLVTALAINLNIIPFQILTEITAFRRNYTTKFGEITVSQYFSPKFPGMAPFPCIVNQYCFIRIGSSNFAIPFFHHLGNSSTKPEKCDCKKMTSNDLQDPFHQCNLFSFLTGFLFFPSKDLAALGEFLYAVKPAFAHAAMFQPSFVASAVGTASPAYPQFSTADFRKKIYKFCAMPSGNCSMVTFTLIDSDNPDWSLSKFYYQLLTGACQDQIAATPSNWQALIDKPFTSLTQDYEECSDNVVYVFFTQLGSALGTMDVILPLSIILTMIFMNAYQKATKDKIPESYSKEEKERALDAFAISLLLTRDFQRKGGGGDAESAPTEEVLKDKRQHEILSEIVKALHLDSEIHGDADHLQKIRDEIRGIRSSVEMVKVRSSDISPGKLSQVVPG